MNRKTLSIFIFLFSALFTFQTFDAHLLRLNPKTCCGRVICLCKHAAGKACPLKSKKHIQEKQAAADAPAAMPCHRKKNPELAKIEKNRSEGMASFSKAPCASDSPKTILAHYFKDYLSEGRITGIPILSGDSSSFNWVDRFSPLGTGKAIEHPPRTF